MGVLVGFPEHVLLMFNDGTHAGNTSLIDYDETESEFDYDQEHVVFWPERPSAKPSRPTRTGKGLKAKTEPKKFAAKVLLFHGELIVSFNF